MDRDPRFVYGLLILGFLLGAFAVLLSRTDGAQPAHSTYAMPPDSFEEIVSRSDLVFEGRVIRRLDGGMREFGPVEDEPLGWPSPIPGPFDYLSEDRYELPITLVEVSLDQLHFIRRPFEIRAGQVVTLSWGMALSDYTPPRPPRRIPSAGQPDRASFLMDGVLPEPGDRRLFLVVAESAPSLAGMFAPLDAYAILDLKGPKALLSTHPPIPLDLVADPSPETVRTELAGLIDAERAEDRANSLAVAANERRRLKADAARAMAFYARVISPTLVVDAFYVRRISASDWSGLLGERGSGLAAADQSTGSAAAHFVYLLSTRDRAGLDRLTADLGGRGLTLDAHSTPSPLHDEGAQARATRWIYISTDSVDGRIRGYGLADPTETGRPFSLQAFLAAGVRLR
jgi:hypothetical protein